LPDKSYSIIIQANYRITKEYAMQGGCAGFLWSVCVVFLLLIGILVLIAEPWLLVLLVFAAIIATLFWIGRFAFQHLLATLLIVGILLAVAVYCAQ
jgi:hypothetical protein